MMKKVSPSSLKINVAETRLLHQLPSDLSGTPRKADEAQDASTIVEKNGKEVPSSPMKDHMTSLNDQINPINFAATSIAAMFSPRKVALEKEVIRLQRALDSATQEMSRMAAAFRIKEMEELSQSEIKLIQQVSSREKASMELRMVKSELFTALSGNKELKRDNEYLTSERSQLIINLESSEETLELTQEKLMKNEKESKHVFEEKNNLAIQLKGSQRELQQIQMEVNDIRNKELWASMEGQLQVKDKAKADEERQKELVLNLAAAKGKEEELQKKTVEMRSLRSELLSSLSINKELNRDKEYLTSERSELVINLETSENELEACQLKLNKIEKDSKVLLEERNNYSIQLKGAQKEFQQMSLLVNDIKNKELWEAMEGQLQAKEKAKADEEKEKERSASLNALSLRDAEIKKQTAEIRSLKSELLSSLSINRELNRDKEYLTSERSELVINLETSENELEACQLKLNKIEKDSKVLLEERNNYSIQLKGAQKEFQQMSLQVNDIKNKELWEAMEGQLQAKEKAKADEEKEKERSASLNTLSLRDAEIKRQTAEIRSLKSELLSAKSGMIDLSREKEYLTIERSELVIILETSENELEACQLTLTKSAKECKILLEERNNYSIQLKGAQKELQQVSMEVSDIKNKELWQAMEGQLQVKANEEKERERSVAAAAQKVKDENMKKQQKEYTSNILMLQSNVREKSTMINNLQRDMENLNEEKLNLAATLDTTENDLEVSIAKFVQIERESKLLLAGRDSMSMQLKGCQKELLELSTVVENIRAKESWGAMEAQLKNQNN